jgi:ABC-2 type transport system ATP-binding protein
MSEAVIEVRNLSKFYQTKPIVYHLNLNIHKGSLFGILGPNGAGKTTTIKMLIGAIKPSSGHISINGCNPWNNRVKVADMIGYLPQNSIQQKEKRVKDFLVFMARLKGFDRKSAILEAREVLHQVGIGRLEENKIAKLSGGEKQRLGFANAILGDPDILLLDEPTASLDPMGRVYIMELIAKMAKDKSKTVIISSHILPEIQRMSNHVAVMSDGSVLAMGNISDLTKNIFDTEYELRSNNPVKLKEILENNNLHCSIDRDAVTVDFNSRLEEMWQFIPKICVDNNIQLKSFKPIKDRLATLFLQLVQKREVEMENEDKI